MRKRSYIFDDRRSDIEWTMVPTMQEGGKMKGQKHVSGTKEWSSHSENIQLGCEHGCLYCYAREMMMRYKRVKTAKDWETPIQTPTSIKKLGRTSYKKREGVIMFPTTHDITPRNIEDVVRYLRMMLESGNHVLIVSKPHLDCIKRLCSEFEGYKNQILFRFTIGSTDDKALKFWEPNAPGLIERLESLKHAFDNGFKTSVSAEPFLDNTLIDLVPKLLPFITDSLWIGKMNKLKLRVNTTGWSETELGFIVRVREAQSDEAIKAIYKRFCNEPRVRWKDACKKVLGLPLAEEAGLDI
jgi:uncharacterized Fe-S cluster-containing radical SAM superfamily protein